MKTPNVLFLLSLLLAVVCWAGSAGGSVLTGSNSDLLLWLDAEDLDADGAVEGALEGGQTGGVISLWSDKATGSTIYNASASSGQQPQYVLNAVNSTLPVVRFTSDRLLTGLTVGTDDNTFTVVAVVRETARHIGGIVGHQTSGNGDIQFGDVYAPPNDHNEGLWSPWSAGREAYGNDNAPVDQNWSVVSLVVNGTDSDVDWSVFTNGIGGTVRLTTPPETTTTNAQIRSLQVGAGNAANEWWSGDIAELAVFNSALNLADRKGVEVSLGGKYGIAVSVAPEWLTPVDVPLSSGPAYPSGTTYTADKAIDGDLDTFSVLLDDTLTGTNPNSIPPYGSAPATGHMIFDLGGTYRVDGVNLFSRDNGGAYNPHDVDFFYFADGNPFNNAIPDDIEGDSDIVLLTSHSYPGLTSGASQSVFWDEAVARYIGMRVNSSYEQAGPTHFNYQIAEMQFQVSIVPEPSTFALLAGAAAMGLVLGRFRRRRSG